MSGCIVDGCEKPGRLKRGMCSTHYQRWKKSGDPLVYDETNVSAMRFIESVAVPFEDKDECLTWPYTVLPNGYGRIKIGRRPKMVSRIVCEKVHGPPPTPKHEAAHSCGKGHEACCNPHHLRWATHKENEHDKFAHGTVGRGALNGMTKLTEEQVLEIVCLKGEISQRELARRYGVNRIAIQGIYKGKSWAWLTGIMPANDNEPLRAAA